jgi:hypothetical protein
MQIQIFTDIQQIQIVLEYNSNKWIGIFKQDKLPSQMTLEKFSQFFTKCYSNETNYTHKIVEKSDELVVKLTAQMDFFTLVHELTFVKCTADPSITRELIDNITKSLETKLNKMITLIDLRKFEPIKTSDLISDNTFASYFAKHRIEFELSKQITNNNQLMLVGYESSCKTIDLSAYPYEYIDWTQINNL